MIHYISAGWQIGRLIRITLRLRAARVRCSAARAASPDAVREALEQEIQRVAAEGLDEAVFRRSKKALYGKYIRCSSDAERRVPDAGRSGIFRRHGV